ncbi:MAG: CoA pyrophosphatase [candidate division Zixibacteria bacterium]|nr:CoA pyrophosphatase [candidate division Zixibacteria bacterium]
MSEPQKAAVLVPVYRRDDGEVVVILVRRTEGDTHGGQIAFPGGKISKSDRTLLDTALREADEEIGLPAENVKIIRQLPNVFTNSSNFEITPFLGMIEKPTDWQPSQEEIAEIIETPVKKLLDPRLHGLETMSFPNWDKPRIVPFIRIGRHKLWGASYRILEPILEDIVDDIFSI